MAKPKIPQRVSSGCYEKIPQAGAGVLKRRTFLSHSPGGCKSEVRGQVSSGSREGSLSVLHSAASYCVRERGRGVGPSLSEGL